VLRTTKTYKAKCSNWRS